MTLQEAQVVNPLPTAYESWKGVNTIAQFALIAVFVLAAIFGNIIGAIIGFLIVYYWFGPWTFNFAKEHNRNVSWAYFYVTIGSLLALLVYYVWVKLTKDP
jgi:hypothetical protein